MTGKVIFWTHRCSPLLPPALLKEGYLQLLRRLRPEPVSSDKKPKGRISQQKADKQYFYRAEGQKKDFCGNEGSAPYEYRKKGCEMTGKVIFWTHRCSPLYKCPPI